MVDKKEGIKMIIALQAFAGIEETEAMANKGWDNMTLAEREQTEWVYGFLLGKKSEQRQKTS